MDQNNLNGQNLNGQNNVNNNFTPSAATFNIPLVDGSTTNNVVNNGLQQNSMPSSNLGINQGSLLNNNVNPVSQQENVANNLNMVQPQVQGTDLSVNSLGQVSQNSQFMSNSVNNGMLTGVQPQQMDNVNNGMQSMQQYSGMQGQSIGVSSLQSAAVNQPVNNTSTENVDTGKKSNKSLIIILVVGVILIGVALFLRFSGILGGNDGIDDTPVVEDQGVPVKDYSVGDVVNISKLSSVNTGTEENENLLDYSGWIVLDKIGEYLLLFGNTAVGTYGNDYNDYLNDFTKNLQQNGLNLSDEGFVKFLSETDLVNSQCDFKNLTCENINSMLKGGTGIVIEGKNVFFNDGNIELVDLENNKVDFYPVIKVLTSEID